MCCRPRSRSLTEERPRWPAPLARGRLGAAPRKSGTGEEEREEGGDEKEEKEEKEEGVDEKEEREEKEVEKEGAGKGEGKEKVGLGEKDWEWKEGVEEEGQVPRTSGE